MRKHYNKLILIPIFLLFTLFGQNVEKEIQTQLILVKNGGQVILPEGVSKIKGTLSLEGKENVTIIGSGMDNTILS